MPPTVFGNITFFIILASTYLRCVATYFLSFTTIQRTPEISKQMAQIAKMMDLSAALFTTSPILNEATNWGNTTDRLKIPMYKPILLW